MNWWSSALGSAAGVTAALAVLAAAQNPPAAGPVQHLKGFRYPMESYSNGKIKTELVAGRMTSGDDKQRIEATDVQVNMYDEGGKVESRLTTEGCVYDVKSNLVTSASAVELRKGNLSLSGRGFEWNITQQVVRVRADVKVVFPRQGTIRAMKEAKTETGGGD